MERNGTGGLVPPTQEGGVYQRALDPWFDDDPEQEAAPPTPLPPTAAQREEWHQELRAGLKTTLRAQALALQGQARALQRWPLDELPMPPNNFYDLPIELGERIEEAAVQGMDEERVASKVAHDAKLAQAIRDWFDEPHDMYDYARGQARDHYMKRYLSDPGEWESKYRGAPRRYYREMATTEYLEADWKGWSPDPPSWEGAPKCYGGYNLWVVPEPSSTRVRDLGRPEALFKGLHSNEAAAIRDLPINSPQLPRWREHASRMGLEALKAALIKAGVRQYDDYGDYSEGSTWSDCRVLTTYTHWHGDLRVRLLCGADPNDYGGNTRYGAGPVLFRLMGLDNDSDCAHAAQPDMEKLKVLLEFGANPDLRYHAFETGGRTCLSASGLNPTPLMEIAQAEELPSDKTLEAVALLLKAGADPLEPLESHERRGAMLNNHCCGDTGLFERDQMVHEWSLGLGPAYASALTLALKRGHVALAKLFHEGAEKYRADQAMTPNGKQQLGSLPINAVHHWSYHPLPTLQDKPGFQELRGFMDPYGRNSRWKRHD